MASGSSSTNQAFVSEEEKAPGPSTDKPAAAAKEKQHWSGVARGAEFQKTVDQLGAKKDQSRARTGCATVTGAAGVLSSCTVVRCR